MLGPFPTPLTTNNDHQWWFEEGKLEGKYLVVFHSLSYRVQNNCRSHLNSSFL